MCVLLALALCQCGASFAQTSSEPQIHGILRGKSPHSRCHLLGQKRIFPYRHPSQLREVLVSSSWHPKGKRTGQARGRVDDKILKNKVMEQEKYDIIDTFEDADDFIINDPFGDDDDDFEDDDDDGD